MLIKNYQAKDYSNSFIYLVFVALISFGSNEAIARISTENWRYASNEVKEICSSFKHISIPPKDLPNDAIRSTLNKCNSDELYFGFENPPDYVKARYCAIINHDYGVLTMIYANAKGVEPNLNLAIHFACLFDSAGAEIDGRIKHLSKLKKYNNPKRDFNICDDITSGYMMAVCADYTQRASVDKQRKQLKAVTLALKPEEQKKLKTLLSKSSLYIEARINNEMDHSGTGAQSFMILEKKNHNAHMIKLINKAMQCNVESYTPDQFQVADKELNILYKKAQQNSAEEFNGIHENGIKITERTWVKYKDAWVSFGLIKCPKTKKETWETLITKDRITQLKELVGNEY